MKKRGKSIFRRFLTAMLAVLVVELCIFSSALYSSNVTGQLNRNAVDILQKQVENRINYLQSMMIQNQDLSELEETINVAIQKQIQAGRIDLSAKTLDSNGTLFLFQSISEKMIEELRKKSVTGIFVVLNTQNLDEREDQSYLPALYFRDLDPQTLSSQKNTDLLLEYAPTSMVSFMGISTDRNWTPMLCYDKTNPQEFLYPVWQKAWEDQAQLNARDYGRWTTSPYTLDGNNRCAIAYSIPLILNDGTVYGVLGIEMLTDYLQTLLPSSEIQNSDSGTYLLAATKSDDFDGDISVDGIGCISGTDFNEKEEAQTDSQTPIAEKIEKLEASGGDYWLTVDGHKYYAAIAPLSLYSRNVPFSNEKWFVAGCVEETSLFSFSVHVMHLLLLAGLLLLVVGTICSLLVSKSLAYPISTLSKEVITARKNKGIPNLSKTGILELDRFANEFTQMSREILDTSTKFLRIMEMASVELGGYEIREGYDTVYVTKNFFSLLGMEGVCQAEPSVEEFQEFIQIFQKNTTYIPSAGGARIYRIVQSRGEVRYIRIKTTENGNVRLGVVEDVTESMMERIRIEHERDYDALTGLYNRRAFQRECEEIFAQPEKLKTAALIMMDLDSLKHTNDTYGHDSGDAYIQQAGKCFAQNTPSGTIRARISGDEFNLLLYGYNSKEEIREKIEKLRLAISQTEISLPVGEKMPLGVSGGIAWYPENTKKLEMMRKYADFAMYQVKHSTKGRIEEFNQEIYDRESVAVQTQREFYQLIEEELVHYHFQPIVSACTGKTAGFEALMRVNMPTIKNPDTVIRIAREEDKLQDIERITMFHAAEDYNALLVAKKVDEDALLFVNSIASQHMTREDEEIFHKRFGLLQKNIVVEITEEESLDESSLKRKQHASGMLGVFALDDYGSGYSNEKSLLTLSPKYIKVDQAIIREIDTNSDKQQIMSNIVSYAHQRSMFIIAEGIENKAELLTVLRLGADLLQGYFLARPQAEPKPISEEALQVIQQFHRNTSR